MRWSGGVDRSIGVGEASHARGEVCGRKSGHTNNPAGYGKRTAPCIYISVAMEQSACLAPVWLECIFAFSQQASEAVPNITTLACPGVRNECAGAGL